MSRKTTSNNKVRSNMSVRENEQALIEEDTMSSSSESSYTSLEHQTSVSSVNNFGSHNQSFVFTRSHCQGGNQCSAGCPLHQKKKTKRLNVKAHESNKLSVKDFRGKVSFTRWYIK